MRSSTAWPRIDRSVINGLSDSPPSLARRWPTSSRSGRPSDSSKASTSPTSATATTCSTACCCYRRSRRDVALRLPDGRMGRARCILKRAKARLRAEKEGPRAARSRPSPTRRPPSRAPTLSIPTCGPAWASKARRPSGKRRFEGYQINEELVAAAAPTRSSCIACR